MEATPESTAKDVADAWWNASLDGSFTLVKLPPGTTGAGGANFTIFSATGDDNNKWALVLTQNAVSVTFSDTHVNACAGPSPPKRTQGGGGAAAMPAYCPTDAAAKETLRQFRPAAARV